MTLNDDTEITHSFHIAEGRVAANATKVWITSSGKALLCNNASQIPQKELRNFVKVIEADSKLIVNNWKDRENERAVDLAVSTALLIYVSLYLMKAARGSFSQPVYFPAESSAASPRHIPAVSAS